MEKMNKNSLIKYLFAILLSIFVSPTFSQEKNVLNKTFLIFLEKEFLSNQIITKKNSNENNITILDLNKSEYLVSFDLLNKNINQGWFLIPTLKIVNKVNNKTYAFSRSIAFEKKSNVLEIETIAKMLVSSSLEQMKINGIKFVISDQQFVDKKEKKIIISLNYFNSCESNKIIEAMEKEFPGFIHLETVGHNSQSKAQLAYYTASTIYKIKKWLALTIGEYGFGPDDFFIKVYKSKIDINKLSNSKYFYVCE
tara:strand:+ start:83 stop:841 length:759 start_codon:yes stop_codon:yes gene_type:complete